MQKAQNAPQAPPLLRLIRFLRTPKLSDRAPRELSSANATTPPRLQKLISPGPLSDPRKTRKKAQKALPPYEPAFHALERRCPDFVEPNRWHQAIEGRPKVSRLMGRAADALGWTARELFGLHTPPERPAATYRRLSRYDETGLIWLLRSRPVVALTATTAAIQGATGILTFAS